MTNQELKKILKTKAIDSSSVKVSLMGVEIDGMNIEWKTAKSIALGYPVIFQTVGA